MKKFLSLVLALVMTMSLVTISAGAKDFTDDSKITYKEAVDVISAVDVVDGYEDGSFNPSATLSRGAAAKIICNLILGPTTASALHADTAPYKDVPTNHTFAGYIAYCQQQGIISGYADGTFRPSATLTSYAFMKMLLGALGYDAAVENYVGDNWSVSVAKRALNIGLDDGLVEAFNGIKAVTREEACLYAFNALQATMVEYDTTITVGNITVAGSKATEVVNNARTETIKDDNKMQFAERFFTDLKLNDEARDDFYRPSNEWKVKSDKIGTYPQAADYTYTKKVENGDIYSDLGSKVAKNDVTVYIDGTEEKSESVAIAKGGDTKVGVSGNGVLTEVYYDADDETLDIIQINTYVGEVTKTVKATDKKDAYIVIADTGVIATAPASNLTYETDETFDDETIVLYTYAKDAKEVKSVEAAEIVTGTVTRAENKKDDGVASQNVTIDGETYKAAAQFAGEEVGSITVKDDYDLYLDSYGYMIKVERIDELSSDYALVLDYQTGSSNSIDGGFNSRKALLVFADGTTKVVSTEKNYAALEHKIVTYKVDDDGVYTLRAVQNTVSGVKVDGTKVVSSTTFDLENGKSQITLDSSVTPVSYTYGNSNTAYVVYNNADDEWDAYTGSKSAPSVKAANTVDTTDKVNVYYYCKSGTMTTIMFIIPDADAMVENNGSKVMFISKESVSNLINDEDGSYYEYEAIINGEVETIKVDYSQGKSLSGFYNRYTVDKYGIYDNLSNIVPTGETWFNETGVSKTSADYTVSFDRTGVNTYSYTYNVDDDAVFYYVDEDGNIYESTYAGIRKDDNDIVFAVVKDDQIKTLVIQEVDDDATDGVDIDVDDYKVNYSGTTITDVLYHKDAAGDVETLLNVILTDLENKGYTGLEVSNTGSFVTIRGFRNNYTYNFSWTSTDAYSAVKVQIDDVDVLVKIGTSLRYNGAAGVYSKVTKADGTSGGYVVNTAALAAGDDGKAYESGYVKFNGATATNGYSSWTLTSSESTGDYVKKGDKIVVTLTYTSNAAFTEAQMNTGTTVTAAGTTYTVALKTEGKADADGVVGATPVVEVTCTVDSITSDISITVDYT